MSWDRYVSCETSCQGAFASQGVVHSTAHESDAGPPPPPPPHTNCLIDGVELAQVRNPRELNKEPFSLYSRCHKFYDGGGKAIDRAKIRTQLTFRRWYGGAYLFHHPKDTTKGLAFDHKTSFLHSNIAGKPEKG
jgi:hypothetical protein